VQRVRLSRLDVILIIVLVVAGAAVWPVTSAVITTLRQDEAPKELDYQKARHVHFHRVRLKGLEDQLGKAREKVVEIQMAEKAAPGELARIQDIAAGYEKNVLEATLALAGAESAASRQYARDLKWHEWKTLGLTMAAAAGINLLLLLVFWFVFGLLLALVNLKPSWSRVLRVSAAIVFLATGYQAGQVSGLLAFILLVTIVGAAWLVVRSLRRAPEATPQPQP
jgi:hypothetical protein